MKIEKAPGWQFKLSVVGHLSIVAIILLYWNPQVAKLVHPATYLIAGLAGMTALYALLPTLYESAKTSVRTLRLKGKATASPSNSVAGGGGHSAREPASALAATNNMAYVDGVMDIGDDDCVDKETMQMVEAFTTALSPSKSLLDTEFVQEAAKDFSDEDLQEDPGYFNASMWVTFAALVVVLGAPLWMSWTFLRDLLLLPM